MDIMVATVSSSDEEQQYAVARKSKSKSTLPKTMSMPAMQTAKVEREFDEGPHYAIPPQLEQPRDVGPEMQDYPPTIIAKRIFLTSVNQTNELRCAWVALIFEILFASGLVALGSYHVIEAHRDIEDVPNTFLSEAVAAAPAPAVSLYFEAITILQLALITLFAGALGFAAYLPHGTRLPAKMAFLIFVGLSIYLGLNVIASISEDIAHKINIQQKIHTYRMIELTVLPFVIIFLMIAAYPACAAFVVFKFEKQTSRFLRILHVLLAVIACLVFLAHVAMCALSLNRGYQSFFLSRFSAAVRLSYAVCALPASIFGVLVTLGTLRASFNGSRQIGVWVCVVATAAILVMYNATPLLGGLFQDVKGDSFDFIYMIQYILHCSCILTWTMMILLGAAFAYVR